MDIYILKNGSKLGPYSEAHIRELLGSAAVSQQDMGWCEGLTDWIPLGLIVIGARPSGTKVPVVQTELGINKRTFRIITGLTILAFVASIVATLMEASQYPSPDPTGVQYAMWGVFLVSVLMQIVAYVGLLFVKKWGRMLFAVSMGVLTLLCFFNGTTSESAASNGLSSIWELLSGALIALSYFTHLFDKSVADQPLNHSKTSPGTVQTKPMTYADFPAPEDFLFGIIPPKVGGAIGGIFVVLFLIAAAVRSCSGH